MRISKLQHLAPDSTHTLIASATTFSLPLAFVVIEVQESCYLGTNTIT